jgi:hypothetical protein
MTRSMYPWSAWTPRTWGTCGMPRSEAQRLQDMRELVWETASVRVPELLRSLERAG